MNKKVNKRAETSTIPMIIAIVIGIAVLVLLIWGFSTGWGNLWGKITNYGGGSSNVDSVIKGCELACTSGNTFAFCTEQRTVKFGEEVLIGDEKVKERTFTCDSLDKADIGSDLSNKQINIDISCSSISC